MPKYRVRTESDHSLYDLFMILLIQLLYRDQLPLRIGDSGGELGGALRKLL